MKIAKKVYFAATIIPYTFLDKNLIIYCSLKTQTDVHCASVSYTSV